MGPSILFRPFTEVAQRLLWRRVSRLEKGLFEGEFRTAVPTTGSAVTSHSAAGYAGKVLSDFRSHL